MAIAQTTGFKPDTAYMEVPRCDQCRYWTHDDPESENEAICQRLVSADCGVTLLAIWKPGQRGKVDVAALVTRSDFGCVQFDAKPLAANGLED